MPDSGEQPLELAPLLKTLVGHGVDFVIVGGMAGLIHGSAYPTFDFDVAYARDDANLERLSRALQELRVTLRGAPADLPFTPDVRSLENGANFTFETGFGMFDVLGDVAGIRAYEDLRSEASIVEVEGFAVRVASIDHLIAMKKAANRPKDRLMVEEYIVIADEQQRLAEAGED